MLWGAEPIWWLPCEVIDLAQPIRPGDLVDDLIADPELFPPKKLEAESDYLEVTSAGVVPKFAIPVSTLSNTLQARYHNLPLPYCEGAGKRQVARFLLIRPHEVSTDNFDFHCAMAVKIFRKFKLHLAGSIGVRSYTIANGFIEEFGVG